MRLERNAFIATFKNIVVIQILKYEICNSKSMVASSSFITSYTVFMKEYAMSLLSILYIKNKST